MRHGIAAWLAPVIAIASWCAVALLHMPSAATAQAVAITATDGADTHLIDLPAALQLAGAQNLDVQLAREKLAEARALHQGALWRFFPWVSVGISYTRHDGQLQATEGDIVTVSRQAYAPGATLVGQWDLGDAIYEKLAAKQLELAAGHAFEAQRQDSLVAAAQGYFDLVFAQAATGVAQEAVRIAIDYETQVRSAVAAGIAFKGDALRVSVQAERNRLALRQAAERQRIAATRLAQTLHLDASVQLVARDADLVPLALMEGNLSVSALLEQALVARPELKRSEAVLQAARENENRAVYGPLIPSVGAQVFGGAMGGGRNGDTGNFGDREDYALVIGWRLGLGGILDIPRQRAAEARLRSARLGVDKARDDIARQVVEALTRVQSQSEQIDTARRGLTAAEEGLRLAQQRREFGVGIVLENIVAEQDLTRARTDYIKAIAEFDKAQYALSKALGIVPATP